MGGRREYCVSSGRGNKVGVDEEPEILWLKGAEKESIDEPSDKEDRMREGGAKFEFGCPACLGLESGLLTGLGLAELVRELKIGEPREELIERGLDFPALPLKLGLGSLGLVLEGRLCCDCDCWLIDKGGARLGPVLKRALNANGPVLLRWSEGGESARLNSPMSSFKEGNILSTSSVSVCFCGIFLESSLGFTCGAGLCWMTR